MIEKKILMYLKGKSALLSKELSSYLSNCFNKDCLMNLLTVENITMGEFKTLIDSNDSTGIIKYEMPYSPIYIHLYGEIKNGQEVIKELLNFTAKNLNSFLPNYKTAYMLSSADELKSLAEDYAVVLISFSIEFAEGDNGFAAVSIPHNLLETLLNHQSPF